MSAPTIVRRGLSYPRAQAKRMRPPPEEPESVLQAKIVQLATMLGWRVQFTWTSIHSPAGWPDLALVRRGQLIFAELKTERGNVSAEQRAWLEDLSQVPGARCFIWRPSDWDGIVRVLQGVSQ